MIDVEAIEDAMLAALRDDAIIATYAGDAQIVSLQGALEQVRAQALVLKHPYIVVGFGGGPVRPFGGLRFKAELRFQVTIVCKNLRSPRAARATAATGEKGTYAVLQDVLRVLSGQTLGLDIDELKPTDTEPLEPTTPGTSEFAVMFESAAVFDLDDETSPTGAATTTADLTTITVEHQVYVDADDTMVTVVTDTHGVT